MCSILLQRLLSLTN